MGVALYSCNPWVSFHVAETYRNGRHRVWCGEVFDPGKESSLAVTSRVPPSSSPIALYRLWRDEAMLAEQHSQQRARVRATLSALAVKWLEEGAISEAARDEILYMVGAPDTQVWRPLMYVIPRTPHIEARLKAVPPTQRAGLAPEYILEDLQRNEFDVLEF